MAVLKVENLNKNYGEKAALKGVSFSLAPGIYGLLGPNGSGKSTLMNILTGNLKATSGRVLWEGKETASMGKTYRALLGYVPQQQALYPDFTAIRFLAYMAALQGMAPDRARERIAGVLEAVGLTSVARKKVKTFSGGMKQRLLIAQSILADPKLLIMDEPSAGLDPKQRVLLRHLISHIAEEDKIVLIATHVVSDVESIAQEFLLLKEGELIRKGGKETLADEVAGHNGRGQDHAPITMEEVYLYHFGGQDENADWI